jgi:uncharacterized damage-inducible protein DinB
MTKASSAWKFDRQPGFRCRSQSAELLLTDWSQEFWVLALAGGRQIARDRDAEFRASGTYKALEVRYVRWMADVREVLSNLPDSSWDRIVEPPPQFAGSVGEETMSVRACVLHAVEHSALHLGQIQLTRSLLTKALPEQANG